MASGSYLKFDGIDDGIRSVVTAPSSSGSLVITAFVRILQYAKSTAPIIGFRNSTGPSYCALWMRMRDNPSGKAYMVSASAQHNSGAGVAERNLHLIRPTTTATSPFRIGHIYKLQLAMDWDPTGGGYFLACFVDGVRVDQLNVVGGSELYQPGTDVYFTIGTLEGDQLTSIAAQRYPHIDVIQAKWEIDRTIAYSGGNMTAPDADSDPFTPMTIDGSAADGALYLMDEGTGSTVTDTSGNGHDISMSGGSLDPDWAPAPDPTFPSPGLARFTFSSIEDLALRHSNAPDVVPVPIMGPQARPDKTAGELRLRPKPPDWLQDGSDVDLWTDATGLTASTTQAFESDKSLRSNNATPVSNRDTPNMTAPSFSKRWLRAWFYDSGGTDAGRLQRITFYTVAGAVSITIGVHIAASSTHYMTGITGPGNVSSGVAFSTGWHEALIYISTDSVSVYATRMYLDGPVVRTDVVTNISLFFVQVGIRQAATGSNGDAYLDWWEVNGDGDPDHNGLVAATGSIVLPLLQPAEGISFLRSVTITEVTAGTNSMERGATTYTFRHSTDGGGSWGGSTSLTTANLRALNCVGNGEDVLEITVAQTSTNDDMASPATRQIDFLYEPARFARILGRGNLGRRTLSNEMKRESMLV